MDKIKMPKYLNTSDEEFCRYLWLENPDPVVARLLNMVDDLVAWRLIAQDPDEVMQQLENKDREIDALSDDITEYQERIGKLEARTVIDMMSELEEDLQNQRRKNKELRGYLDGANRELEVATDKLNMWAIMNR